MNRAIIQVGTLQGEAERALAIAREFEAGRSHPEQGDYYLTFASAAKLFAELTAERLRTLETLKREGAQSIYALAKALGRNYSNVHGDVQKLIEHGLAEKDVDARVFVPRDVVEIHVALGARAA